MELPFHYCLSFAVVNNFMKQKGAVKPQKSSFPHVKHRDSSGPNFFTCKKLDCLWCFCVSWVWYVRTCMCICPWKHTFTRQSGMNRDTMFVCQTCFKNLRIHAIYKILKVTYGSISELFTNYVQKRKYLLCITKLQLYIFHTMTTTITISF